MQIDTVNPGEFEWKSFWKPNISNYTGTYFDNSQKQIEDKITSNTSMYSTNVTTPSGGQILRLNCNEILRDKQRQAAENDKRTAEEVDASYYKNVSAFMKAREDFEKACNNALQRIKD